MALLAVMLTRNVFKVYAVRSRASSMDNYAVLPNCTHVVEQGANQDATGMDIRATSTINGYSRLSKPLILHASPLSKRYSLYRKSPQRRRTAKLELGQIDRL